MTVNVKLTDKFFENGEAYECFDPDRLYKYYDGVIDVPADILDKIRKGYTSWNLTGYWHVGRDEYTDVDCESDNGEFLVWSPDSDQPSTRIFTAKQARKVAHDMAEEHGGTFYVARLTHKYTSTATIIKEVL